MDLVLPLALAEEVGTEVLILPVEPAVEVGIEVRLIHRFLVLSFSFGGAVETLGLSSLTKAVRLLERRVGLLLFLLPS